MAEQKQVEGQTILRDPFARLRSVLLRAECCAAEFQTLHLSSK